MMANRILSVDTAGLPLLLGAWLLATMLVGCQRAETSVEPPRSVDLNSTRQQAERGDAAAQYELGKLLAGGADARPNYAEAAAWYRRAADQGHAPAQAALAELYEAGQGVPFDPAEAARWFRRAAEQGHAVAQFSLAALYVAGKGVPRDIDEALKWYRRAAEQGDARAQYILGARYRDGDGLAADPVEAFKWLSLAAAQGDKEAVAARDDLKRRLSREQIAEAQRRVRAFAPVTPPPAR